MSQGITVHGTHVTLQVATPSIPDPSQGQSPSNKRVLPLAKALGNRSSRVTNNSYRQDEPGTHSQHARRKLVAGWSPPKGMQRRDWITIGVTLGEMGRVTNWWIGDWLRYGNTQWGEKYAEASRITGFDTKTLRNFVYVASHFELSRRRSQLTWSHHAELTALNLEAQDHWLNRAIQDRLSVADLRIELRAALHDAHASLQSHRNGTPPQDLEHDTVVICPACGVRVPVSLSQATADLNPARSLADD